MVYSLAAHTLINSARMYASNRNNHALDVMHVMAFALEHPEYAGAATDVLVSLDQAKRANWVRMIHFELDLHPRDVGGSGYPASANYTTPLFSACEQLWNARADTLSAYVGVNCALVLGTILANDQTLQGMAFHCDINLGWLIQSLEARVSLPEPQIGGVNPPNLGHTYPPAPLHGPGMLPPPMPPIRSNGPAFGTGAVQPTVDGSSTTMFVGQSLVARFIDVVRPTRSHVFGTLHTNYMLKLRPYLSEHGRARGMYILAGQRGSPVSVMHQVLADYLSADGGTFTVGLLHLGDVLDEMQHDAAAVEYLSIIAREAANQHMILILDQLELLRSTQIDQDTRDRVREELSKPSSTPPIGIYLLGESEVYDHEQVRLGIAGAISEPVESLGERETRALLITPFLGEWERLGFTFRDREKAFDWTFRLAPYLREDTRPPYLEGDARRFLPYAVLDVGRDLIATLIGNPDKQVGFGMPAGRDVEMNRLRSIVSGLAVEAERRILRLTAPERVLPADVKEILHRAKDEIHKLVGDSAPHYAKGQTQIELTRAHLLAQVLFPSGTQLRPFAPVPASVTQSVPPNS